MKEKFFTIVQSSDFYAAYVQYMNDLKLYRMAFREFLNTYEIEGTEYVPSDKIVMIVPTEYDLKNFDGMFTKKIYEHGLRCFKRNSRITKEWLEIVKTKNLKVPVKPNYLCYGLVVTGRIFSRCFMIGEIMYGSIEADSDIELLDFMSEIKASVFWKIIEDEEERHKNAE